VLRLLSHFLSKGEALTHDLKKVLHRVNGWDRAATGQR
jgi:hypothetical protein